LELKFGLEAVERANFLPLVGQVFGAKRFYRCDIILCVQVALCFEIVQFRIEDVLVTQQDRRLNNFLALQLSKDTLASPLVRLFEILAVVFSGLANRIVVCSRLMAAPHPP